MRFPAERESSAYLSALGCGIGTGGVPNVHVLTYSPRGIFPRLSSRVASSEGERREETQCVLRSLGSFFSLGIFLRGIKTTPQGFDLGSGFAFPFQAKRRKARDGRAKRERYLAPYPKPTIRIAGARFKNKKKGKPDTGSPFAFCPPESKRGQKKPTFVWNAFPVVPGTFLNGLRTRLERHTFPLFVRLQAPPRAS